MNKLVFGFWFLWFGGHQQLNAGLNLPLAGFFRPTMMHWLMSTYLHSLKLHNEQGEIVVRRDKVQFVLDNLAGQSKVVPAWESHNKDAQIIRTGYNVPFVEHDGTRIGVYTKSALACGAEYEDGRPNGEETIRRIDCCSKIHDVLKNEIKAGRNEPWKAELHNGLKIAFWVAMASVLAHVCVETVAELLCLRQNHTKQFFGNLFNRFCFRKKHDQKTVEKSKSVGKSRHGTSMIKRKIFLALIIFYLASRGSDGMGLLWSAAAGYSWCPLNIRYWSNILG